MSVRIRSVTASGCALLLTVPIRNGAEAGSDSNESAAGMLPRKNNPCVLGGARLSFPCSQWRSCDGRDFSSDF